MTCEQHWHWLVKGFSGLVNGLHQKHRDETIPAMPEHVQRELEAWIGTLNAILYEQRNRLTRQRMDATANRRMFTGLDWSGLAVEVVVESLCDADGKRIGRREEWMITGEAGG